jgi:NAD(P)-dependent dehydrogenase (short-subunit alcohol dehydrogenase family)
LNLIGIYTPRLGYAQSKTANILMANEIERKYGLKGLHALSVQPGVILTRAQRFDDPEEIKTMLAQPKMRNVLKSVEQGAATQVWAAVGKVWEGRGGVVLKDCGVARETADEVPMFEGGYAGFVFDEVAEKRL